MSKRLLSIAAAGLALASGGVSATTFLDFTVNEGSVPGAAANVFTADKLNGAYTEYLKDTGGGTFSAQAYANFGQYFKNDGATLVPSQLNGFGTGYGMYALFGATGTFVGNTFTGVTGEFYLYIDPSMDTTFSASNGVAQVATGGDADDYLIASTTSFTNGAGDTVGPPGAFDIFFNNFTLTAAGSAYFTAPVPFHMITQVNGDIDGFTLGDPVVLTGDVSAVFRLPEPGSLALAGLALAGLGLLRRRKA